MSKAVLEVYERLELEDAAATEDHLVLDYLQRERSRFKAVAASGADVRVFLERGKSLQIGEGLRTRCGKTLSVVGATEPVMKATALDWEQFAKACYHLGNRHVKVQIGERCLTIKPDHVLASMLLSLGLQIVEQDAVFVPESGAYAQSSGHDHDH